MILLQPVSRPQDVFVNAMCSMKRRRYFRAQLGPGMLKFRDQLTGGLRIPQGLCELGNFASTYVKY